MPAPQVDACKTAIVQYQSNFSEEKWVADANILARVISSYTALDSAERTEIDGYINGKLEAIRPLNEAIAELKTVGTRALIGAVAVPALDAYFFGTTSITRLLCDSLLGGLGMATTGMSGGLDPSKDLAQINATNPLNDIYTALSSIPKLDEAQNSQDRGLRYRVVA